MCLEKLVTLQGAAEQAAQAQVLTLAAVIILASDSQLDDCMPCGLHTQMRNILELNVTVPDPGHPIEAVCPGSCDLFCFTGSARLDTRRRARWRAHAALCAAHALSPLGRAWLSAQAAGQRCERQHPRKSRLARKA
jgi:hypothetical protein